MSNKHIMLQKILLISNVFLFSPFSTVKGKAKWGNKLMNRKCGRWSKEYSDLEKILYNKIILTSCFNEF